MWIQKILLITMLVFSFLVAETTGDISTERQTIESFIENGQFEDAQIQLDQLKVSYSDSPELPSALYWIGRKYRWIHKWEEANDVYQQIVQNYPDSSYADKASLGLARVRVLSLLNTKDFRNAEQALNGLVTDFSNHPDLPEALYWVGREFGWNNKYEKEQSLYQQIVRNYPDSSFANKLQLDSSRAQVMSLIASKKYDEAQIAITQIVSGFSSHPDFPESLYRIAERYRWSDEYEKAKEIYEQLIQEYAQGSFADKARQQHRVIIQGIDVFALIESGREQEAQSLINQLMGNPADDENDDISLYTIFLCGDRYYASGLEKIWQGFKEEASVDFTKAINIWEQIIQQAPDCDTKAHAYYRSANCFALLGQYEWAVERYATLIDNFPNYEFTWDAKFKIGHYYQRMKSTGIVSKSEADALTEAVYEQLLVKYPDCPASRAAGKWLDKHAK